MTMDNSHPKARRGQTQHSFHSTGSMNILCFDISTGGLAAAVFDENLQASKPFEIPWRIVVAADGAATLDVAFFNPAVAAAIHPGKDRGNRTVISIEHDAVVH